MHGIVETFEVKVRSNGRSRTLHFTRSSCYQAIEEGQKHGIVEWCRKVPKEKVYIGSIKNIELDDAIEMVTTNPFKNAIAMDSMIWKKKTKREERLKNNHEKDKNGIDNE